MNVVDFKELKKGGMMRQKEAGRFSVRLHVVGGGFSAEQMRAVCGAAERFGCGTIHLTARQGVEIPNVPTESLAAVKEFLGGAGVGVGVCGPTVRTVTACQGCRICPSGVIDAPELAVAVDREFYGQPVPHKFKVGISGCANNCLKAEENDIGIKGWIEPRWGGKACTFCGICAAVCPSKTIEVSPEQAVVSVSHAGCIGCGDCIESCPTRAMGEGNRGYQLYAGGKFGRAPMLGWKIFRILCSPEEVMAAVRSVIEFYRAEGRSRERFGDTLMRTGFDALESRIAVRTGGAP